MTALMKRHPRAVAAVLLLTAFTAGVASALAYARARVPMAGRTIVNVSMRRELPTELLQLDLSDDQRDRILAELDSARVQTVRLLEAFDPQLQALLDTADTRLQAVLTPDQRTKLAAIRAKAPRRMIQRETVIDGKRRSVTDSVRK